MSLLDELIERAGDEVDEHADDWLARGLEAARREVERRREELRAQAVDPGYDPEQKRVEVETALLAHAGDAIEVLDERRGAIAALGRARFAAVLVQLGAGREGEARRLALASGSTFAERRAASAASTEATLAAAAAREQAWREVLAAAREVGLLALKAALPILLAVI